MYSGSSGQIAFNWGPQGVFKHENINVKIGSITETWKLFYIDDYCVALKRSINGEFYTRGTDGFPGQGDRGPYVYGTLPDGYIEKISIPSQYYSGVIFKSSSPNKLERWDKICDIEIDD